MPELEPSGDIGARQILRKAIPKVICDIEGVSMTADTDITGATDLEPEDTPCTWRISVVLDQAAKFAALITYGPTEYKMIFNGGTDLAADCLYTFDILVHYGDTVTFQCNATIELHILRVIELVWGGN